MDGFVGIGLDWMDCTALANRSRSTPTRVQLLQHGQQRVRPRLKLDSARWARWPRDGREERQATEGQWEELEVEELENADARGQKQAGRREEGIKKACSNQMQETLEACNRQCSPGITSPHLFGPQQQVQKAPPRCAWQLHPPSSRQGARSCQKGTRPAGRWLID